MTAADLPAVLQDARLWAGGAGLLLLLLLLRRRPADPLARHIADLDGAVRAITHRGFPVSALQVVRPAGQGPMVLTATQDGPDGESAIVELYGPHQRGGGFLRPKPGVHAARAVSFALPKGRTLDIVGESGSGKSLTALAVLGLLPDEATATGSVRWNGREILGLPDRELAALRHGRQAPGGAAAPRAPRIRRHLRADRGRRRLRAGAHAAARQGAR